MSTQSFITARKRREDEAAWRQARETEAAVYRAIIQAEYDKANEIVSEVCREYAVSWEDITGQRRMTLMLVARCQIVRRLKAEVGWGPSMIGCFVRRHHSTVIDHLKSRCKCDSKELSTFGE